VVRARFSPLGRALPFLANPRHGFVTDKRANLFRLFVRDDVKKEYLLQIAILGMTTNERMNSGRYSHFRGHGHGHSHASPFSRGCWQNSVDFLGWSCRGFLKPNRDDWFHRYDVDDDVVHAGGDSERSTLLGSSNGIV